MAFTEKRLFGPQIPAAVPGGVLYTCPTGQTTTTIVKQVVATVPSLGGVFALHLVPYGDTPSATNKILDIGMNPNETIIFDLSQVLTSGDYLYATSSASASLTISGVENAGGMVVSGLADSAVTTAKIADSNVTASKLGPNAFLANNQAGAIITMEMM